MYTHLNGAHGRIPLGQFKIGRIALDRQPHLTNQVVGDPHIHEQEWARRMGMVAFAGHPLVVNDKVVGVIALFARHELPDAVVGALASVADHIALGLERHRNAVALVEAEERMRFALQATGAGVWDMDHQSGVLRWSPLLEAQYGLAPGSFGGTVDAFLERIHPDDRQSVVDTIAGAVTAGSDFTLRFRTVWPDGSLHWISGIGREYSGSDGKPRRGLGISFDVTDRHQLEEQYLQAQKMEAVGRLAGGVAHDFNNLLTAILGYCELLLPAFGPGDPRRADLEEIQKAGTSAAGLTRQLLTFSRKQVIEPTVLDLNLVVADMLGMIGRLIGEDVTVAFERHQGAALVKADRGQIEQVVMNLAVNARDAMRNGGVLGISIAGVDIDERDAATGAGVKPGAFVVLAVTDTGTGMSPEVQAHLFEPFFTTKAVGKGTGLGLATVHGIVTQNGGVIDVDSAPGRGTSFHVYFPQASDVRAAGTEDAPPDAQPGALPITLLLVDDSASLRQLATRVLQRDGARVLAAADAEEAKRLFEQNPSIELLVTDVVMPGESGPELALQLLRLRPTLRVLYMSGYTEAAIIDKGIPRPGIAFLPKPFTGRTLRSKIREVLARP
jgi:PAS domain S-box-containing protein